LRGVPDAAGPPAPATNPATNPAASAETTTDRAATRLKYLASPMVAIAVPPAPAAQNGLPGIYDATVR